MEAALIITVMALGIIIFMAVMSGKLTETKQKKDRELLEDIAFVLQKETTLAASAEDGYYREFEIPQTLNGRNYTINLRGSDLEVAYTDYLEGTQAVTLLPQGISGSPCTGTNSLQKIKGLIVLNCSG